MKQKHFEVSIDCRRWSTDSVAGYVLTFNQTFCAEETIDALPAQEILISKLRQILEETIYDLFVVDPDRTVEIEHIVRVSPDDTYETEIHIFCPGSDSAYRNSTCNVRIRNKYVTIANYSPDASNQLNEMVQHMRGVAKRSMEIRNSYIGHRNEESLNDDPIEIFYEFKTRIPTTECISIAKLTFELNDTSSRYSWKHLRGSKAWKESSPTQHFHKYLRDRFIRPISLLTKEAPFTEGVNTALYLFDNVYEEQWHYPLPGYMAPDQELQLMINFDSKHSTGDRYVYVAIEHESGQYQWRTKTSEVEKTMELILGAAMSAKNKNMRRRQDEHNK